LDQFTQVREELVPEEELQRAKSYLRGKLSLSLEDPLGLSMYLTKQQLFHNETIAAEEYLKRIDAITSQDIKMVAQEIFQQPKLNLAIISPQPDEAKLSRILAL
jgi:predicted Zn-dependent peptidase